MRVQKYFSFYLLWREKAVRFFQPITAYTLFIYYSTWAIKELLKPQCFHAYFLFCGNNFQGLEFLMEFLILFSFHPLVDSRSPITMTTTWRTRTFDENRLHSLAAMMQNATHGWFPMMNLFEWKDHGHFKMVVGHTLLDPTHPNLHFSVRAVNKLQGEWIYEFFLWNYGTLGGKTDVGENWKNEAQVVET